MLDLDALVLGPTHAVFGEVNRGFPMPYYVPQNANAFSIDGVFWLPSIPVLAYADEPGINTRRPVLDIRVSQLPVGVMPLQGDNVTVRGVVYVIADVALDGDGLATLTLRESA